MNAAATAPPAVTAPAGERAAFIRHTYLHLAGNCQVRMAGSSDTASEGMLPPGRTRDQAMAGVPVMA